MQSTNIRISIACQDARCDAFYCSKGCGCVGFKAFVWSHKVGFSVLCVLRD